MSEEAFSASSASSLILPGQQAIGATAIADLPPVVWLRNPNTGVIHKFLRAANEDSIRRCLSEGYLHSDEAAARRQAVELAHLQGRALPEVSDNGASSSTLIASESPADAQRREEQHIAEIHERNESARKAFGAKK